MKRNKHKISLWKRKPKMSMSEILDMYLAKRIADPKTYEAVVKGNAFLSHASKR